ncbi:MAG: hypothetical protein ACD_45C00745G0002 [uncultured bacterium]|nr:MAG: hypothetical protein ACD_45C00745G0002 [uncultured bacterium]
MYVKRYVYQPSCGGKIHVPLEMNARIIHSATPKFAKMLSHKYASMSAKDALDDLSLNHGREISKRYLQGVTRAVFEIVDNKESVWEYVLPEFESSIATISFSMDGAMLPTCEDGWRESMVGTASLFDDQGKRRHTIYVGEPPEYGKSNFMNRFEKEIEKIKIHHPSALYIGIADGAKNNWPFLEKHTNKQLLDFYHVTEYLTKCSYAAFPQKTGKQERIRWLNERCHQLKHDKNAPLNIFSELKKFKRKRKLSTEVRENVLAAITYFKNNLHRMNYAKHTENNLPIGSGVTEAACKTLIKQRFCKSGMRWKNDGIKNVLRLRELTQTNGRWQQLWGKINQYGVPCIH